MTTFLLEIGTEELPATFVSQAIAQWQKIIPNSLQANFLTNETVNVYATPRRLAVAIAGLPTQQPDRQEEIKGPPASSAFKDGQPTQAAIGFAKKQGVEVEALTVRPTDKGDFIFIEKKTSGRPTAEILTELIPQWIDQLEGKRFMRWADGDLRFPRPIRWIVALIDDQILPFTLVNGADTITSDRLSQGHRVLHPEVVNIQQAADYVETLRKAYVEVDSQQRRQTIQTQVEATAKTVNGVAEIPDSLLDEVVDLVEWPTAVVGKFDEEFLILPAEVTTTVMVTHQRYFPVLANHQELKLLPYFITISNGDPQSSAIISAGNERVIRARLADGQFFYKADISEPLDSNLPALAKVTFQEDLGSMRDKVDRIIHICDLLSQQLNLPAGDRTNIARAALLCKADLVSQMVYEFPELQGIMGEKYARASQENEAVAVAIVEHYLPKGANDSLPQSIAGQIVGMGDRFDTLVSIFGLGMLPTGSSDPFALRRAANAIVNVTWAANLPINLLELLNQLVTEFQAKHPNASPQLFTQLTDFFLQRVKTLLQDEKGVDYDLVNAVLGENDPEYAERALQDLLDVRDRALFLQSIRNNGTLGEIYEVVNRAARLASQGDLTTNTLDPMAVINEKLFEKKSEQGFYDSLLSLVPQIQQAQVKRDYQILVDALLQITPAVNNFFDGADSVLVMDNNPEIKRNRLNLLGLLRNHARVLADFGQIVKV
jgi:glycyl-tRNA synthetase beta chain